VGAFFIFTIGENQRRLFEAADALPWGSIAGEAWTVDRGHGRIDVRTIKTLPSAEPILARWPEAGQVSSSSATATARTGNCSAWSPSSASPASRRTYPTLPYLRGHWSIEVHHYVRDVILREDASRTRSAYRAMAAVRNAVVGILHLHQVPNIAARLRVNHRDSCQLPMRLLGLMTPLAPNGNLP
jgi:hypothetical protein